MRTYLAPVILILAALLGLAAAPVLAAAPKRAPAKPGGEFPLHIVHHAEGKFPAGLGRAALP